MLETVQNDPNWTIEAISGVEAQVNWQRTIIGQNTPIAVNNDLFVFHQSILGCENDESVVAINIDTAVQTWTHPAQLVRNIQSVETDFLFVECCSTITRIDSSGVEQWQSEDIPARIFRPNLFLLNEILYFPTEAQIYTFDADDGSNDGVIEMENVVAVFYDVLISSIATNHISVTSRQNNERLWSKRVRIPTKIFLNEEILIFNLNSQIDAYNVLTGELLWTIRGDFNAYPIVIDQLLITHSIGDVLAWHDTLTGEKIAEVDLIRSERLPVDQFSIHATLATNGEHIFVLYNNYEELIALRYELHN